MKKTKDSDITVIDAIKNIKLSSTKKLALMLWRLLMILSVIFIVTSFFEYGDNWDSTAMLIFGTWLALSLIELATGIVSPFTIKFLNS